MPLLKSTTFRANIGSVLTLVAMFLTGISAWGAEHAEHGHGSSALDMAHALSLLGVIGSVLGAWLAKSPFGGPAAAKPDDQ